MPPPPRSLQQSPVQPSDFLGPEVEPRKRVTKACDRCRLKKIKCDGQLPCSRCQAESSLCRYSDRKKTVDRKIPPGYVEYLEEQQQLLVRALKKSYLKSMAGPSNADPSINQILTETGVLTEAAAGPSASLPELPFEEDLDALRARFEDETDYPSSSASLAETSGPTGTVASSPEPSLSDRVPLFRTTATPQPNSAPHTPQIPAPAPLDMSMTDLSHAPTWPQPQPYFPAASASAPSPGSYWNSRMQSGPIVGRSMLGIDTRSSTSSGGVFRSTSQPSRPSQPPHFHQQQQHHQQQHEWPSIGWDPRTVAAGPGLVGYNYDSQTSLANPFTVSPSELQLDHIPEDFPFPEDPILRTWYPENRDSLRSYSPALSLSSLA